MIRFARDFRLIPIVLVAVGALFILKSFGLVLDGGYTLGERLANRGKETLKITQFEPPATIAPAAVNTGDMPATPTTPRSSWASTVFNYPDVTGSVGENKSAAEIPLKVTEKPTAPIANSGGTAIPLDSGRSASAGERAILERLHDRRQELDARGREMEMRESLIKAAEKRLEARVAELKEVENRIGTAMNKRDEAETTRFKSLVTMYESMKAKDAARIFERLDMKILLEVSTQINPRRMSDILSQMSSEAAERLTVALANRASAAGDKPNPGNLPKIEGRPAGG